ncbi:MAG TPA: phytanoyl-CoA dioxygenase family protein [Longimicrobium sp.]|nr:phytanoyl-CoA dioxygenase family protein [Longimicrobium sp.]
MPLVDRAPLSAEQLQAYQEQGYLIVRGLLDEPALQAIRSVHQGAVAAACEALASGDSPANADDWDRGPDGTLEVRKVGAPFTRFPEFREVVASDAVLDIVAALIGPEVYLHSSKLMCKPARVGRRKPWHQDWAYWDDMDPRQLTMWCAVDPATRQNGCIELIPGSHRWGLIQHEQLDDWQIRESRVEGADVRFAEMDPGDVLFMDVLTLHASGPNQSSEARLAALVNFDGTPRRSDQHSPYGSTVPLRARAATD